MSDVEAWEAFEDWNGSTGHYRGSEQEVAFEAFAAGFRLGQRMTSHVHDPEGFVTDEGHVHEWCRRCGREWHLGTPRDPWEVLDECPHPSARAMTSDTPSRCDVCGRLHPGPGTPGVCDR